MTTERKYVLEGTHDATPMTEVKLEMRAGQPVLCARAKGRTRYYTICRLMPDGRLCLDGGIMGSDAGVTTDNGKIELYRD